MENSLLVIFVTKHTQTYNVITASILFNGRRTLWTLVVRINKQIHKQTNK